RGYLIAAPSVFRADVEESVSVTIFNPVKETRVQVQLWVKGEVVASSHGTVLDKGTIKLKVPPGLRGQAHLKVWGNRHLTEEGYIFHNYTTVTVDSKGAAVFIQTDKPVYKPRQKVLVNIFSVTPDLRPARDKVDAYVVDPRGSRMIQWTDLKPVCCGIVNVSFPLSDQPVFGEWFIFVDMQGHTYNKSFEVQKYITPKFELLIDPPRYIRDLNTCEKATVRARTGGLEPAAGESGGGERTSHRSHPYIRTEAEQAASRELDYHIADSVRHSGGWKGHFLSGTCRRGEGTSQSRVVLYDPGLPLVGRICRSRPDHQLHLGGRPPQVEVTYPDGSPADRVRVRVKAELTPKDNVYTSELLSRDGRVEFEIPSIPTAAQYVWLETKVTAIDGQPAGDQYLPSYLSISSWYSPSKCHLQLQSPGAPLQVGREAQIALKSTCPCNFSLHYEIASRGNIIQSGLQPANITQYRGKRAAVTFDKNIHTTAPPSASGAAPPPLPEETDSCVAVLGFLVTPAMAPLSRLLVYYVRDNGEGVTDSIQLPVQPAFENQVSISLSTNESMPGDSVSIRVRGEKGSCVCVAAVDKSLYLLKPGFQLTKDKVFQELREFDVSDAFGIPKDEGHFWWPGLSSRRRRRSSVFPWHWDIAKDARFAFTETGLVVMTDLVSLNHRQSEGMYTDEAVPAFQPHTGTLVAGMHPRAAARAERRRRSFFPDTWVWRCLNVSDVTGEAELRLDVPDSITTWVAEAIGLSETRGLGLAQSAELRSFKPFFVEFTLPYSVIRGEQTKVLLTVYNYLPTCAEVHIKVSVPKGIKFVGHPGKHHLTRKKCVAPGEATPTPIVLSFTELGVANITARAVAYSEPGCCTDGLQAPRSPKSPEDTDAERKAQAGLDHVRRSVRVEPEGLPREYTYSVFFCPNEKIHISTPNKYEYQYVKKPGRMTGFVVAVKAHNDAHVALSASAHDTAEMVEIVIGGHQNTGTWISLGKMGEPVASAGTPGILSWDEFRSFWISWGGGRVQVGHGAQPSDASAIVEWGGVSPGQVRHIGFSTGWGSAGEFKIWRKEDSDENHNEAFTLGVPHNMVPGSERATASMIGDVMGPTLNNLDKLLRLPFGCGEQNMIHFAPNVFVLRYLKKTRQLSPEVETEATDYLLQGYQRQLTYKRQDGSYSAFGERDSSGSMWLTAFVLKSFAQSQAFIFIDPAELRAAKDWIITQQREDGSFPAVGRILNKDLQGGIHGKISLTAYVVAALLETGVSSEEEKGAVSKAKHFLETNTYSAEDPYTTALSAYALTLLRSSYAPLALRRLNHMAITQDGFTHWSLMGSTVTDEDTFMGFSDGLGVSLGPGQEGGVFSVTEWKGQQMNVFNKSCSSHAQSFLVWSCPTARPELQPKFGLRLCNLPLNCSLSSSCSSTIKKSSRSKHKNRTGMEQVVLPLLVVTGSFSHFPTGRFISERQFEGCCKGPRHCRLPIMPLPSRWLHSGSSNMAVLEVPLLSGFRPDVESLEKVLMDKRVGLKRYEVDGRKVLFYFDEIPSQCMTCVSFQAVREYIVGKTAPVPVKVYDYYEPAFEATRFYNASQSSPLARELCDGTTCNEVESSTSHWSGFVQPGSCHNVFGCPEEERSERCTCARDCGYDGDLVCGSDGGLYQNQCQMEVAACRNGTRIEQVPLNQCPTVESVPDEGELGIGAVEEQEPVPLQTGEEDPSSLAEVSYYSYEYDSEPFLPEGESEDVVTPRGEGASEAGRPPGSEPQPTDPEDTPER
uniref:C3 and PZP like alpha-2-macroglobulin domain containing 8 n=1 Tax=Lepisosteus oculatus TaxID=7918 RepID=W5MEU5_LEPOC